MWHTSTRSAALPWLRVVWSCWTSSTTLDGGQGCSTVESWCSYLQIYELGVLRKHRKCTHLALTSVGALMQIGLCSNPSRPSSCSCILRAHQNRPGCVRGAAGCTVHIVPCAGQCRTADCKIRPPDNPPTTCHTLLGVAASVHGCTLSIGTKILAVRAHDVCVALHVGRYVRLACIHTQCCPAPTASPGSCWRAQLSSKCTT